MTEVSGDRVGELRRAEDRFRLLTGNIDEVLLIATADLSEVEYVSPAYEDVFGRSVESLYEAPWSFLDAVHPEDRDEYETDVEAMLADFEAGEADERYEGEYRLGGEDDVRWVRVERYPVREEDRVERFVGLIEDVTERRELERTYRDVFEGVSDGLVVHEPETGEILDVNDRYCELTGYSRDELVGNDIDIIVPDDPEFTLDVAAERIERAREEGRQLFEFRGAKKGGGTFMGEVHLNLVELRGEERVLASVRDITERKRQERVIRALHESTERIQNARTREAVCEAAVDAATAVLDLSMPACWLATDTGEGEDGEADDAPVLEPVAASDAAWAVRDGPGTFEPGSVPYGAYERGETLVYDPGERREETPLDVGVLVPLGEHGLLGAADPGVEEYDDVILDAARTLARHTTAALDRVARAEERRESERRLRTVLERIDEAVLLTDEGHLDPDAGDTGGLTAGYEPIWGRSYGDIVGEDDDEGGGTGGTILDTVHPDDREAYRGAFEAVVEAMDRREATDGRSLEYRIERPDGEERWVRSDVYPLLWDEAGHRLVVVSRDITERVRRQREYEQMFNTVNDAISVHHPETGDILEVNDTYVDEFGYDESTIRELGVGGLSVTEEGYTKERSRELIREVAETGESVTVEWLVETADGERRWYEVNTAPATIGGDLRVLGISRDITERKETEQRLQRIADRVDEVVYMASPDMAEVEYVSPGYEDVWGVPVERLYDDPFSFIEGIHPEDREEYREEMEAMLADFEAGEVDERYEFDYRVQQPDGEVRWVEATGYPLRDASGAVDRLVGMIRDVTGREERQRTLSSFHDATRELTEADSREAASRQAVEAAERILEFPLVSVHLYDETAGALEPVAATDRLADRTDALPTFGPGDGLPWEVFVDGEAVLGGDAGGASDGGGTGTAAGETGVYGAGVPDPGLALPLGGHGVMLVGAPDTGFADGAVELAQILAATLEAALNHVRGRDELAEREERLAEHRERADRLERLNRVIREVEAATVEGSSRGAIERALCERLTAVDPYEVAWVLGPDATTERLVPRVRTGDGAGLGAGSVDLSVEPPRRHPAAEAFETGSPVAVRHLATGGRGEWRRAALRAGCQSLLAVPLAYEGTVHGVVCVAADDPTAFEEGESALADLGRSVGHAISVLERREALESDATTELEFRTADRGLAFVRLARETGAEVTLERAVRRSGGSFGAFYTVEGTDPDRAAATARNAPGVESVTRVSTDADEGACLLELTRPSWFGTDLADYGAVVRTATADGDGGELVVEAPRGADVRALVETLRSRYPDTELVAQRSRDRAVKSLLELQDLLSERLTPRQLEALETAHSAGYFEWPRENSGEEIADLLGVTQPTFNKHIRAAERKAFGMLLERAYEE